MATTNWSIDPVHSEVQFKVKHLVISTVTGSFTKFSGHVTTEKDDFDNAQVTFSIDVDSINTNNVDRDNHLKSDDFFSADKFPSITLADGKLKKLTDDKYELHGNFTIRDVTKPIDLQVVYGGTATDPWGNVKAGFEVTGSINRKDFGLAWSAATEAGGLVVADEIKLNINIELARG